MVRREGRREGKESEGINGGNNREGLWLLEKEKERKREREREREKEREREGERERRGRYRYVRIAPMGIRHGK